MRSAHRANLLEGITATLSEPPVSTQSVGWNFFQDYTLRVEPKKDDPNGGGKKEGEGED